MVSPPRALLSVSDKEGLVDFARGLRDLGFELIGTDGTAKILKEAGLPVTTVADYTGLREELALEAFEYTARYDAAIFNYLASRDGRPLPPVLRLAYDKIADLRYGENPYQQAALYREPYRFAATATAERLQGLELSYNNLIDLDAALRVSTEFERPAAVVIKHTNPSGVAIGTTLAHAYEAAHAAD